MKTIQIANYRYEGEEITEIVAVKDMTQEKFDIQVEEVELFDDGGSHILVEYTQSRVDELIERNASNLGKLGSEYTLFLNNEKGEHSEEAIIAVTPSHAKEIANAREYELNKYDYHSWSVIVEGY
tara:strand:- start:151 stop:525 length:375 start_codon:yes stop_codon:yes gene_type:complete